MTSGKKWQGEILAELGIENTLTGELPEGVRAHKREADGIEYLFVQNYSEVSAEDIFVGEGYVFKNFWKLVFPQIFSILILCCFSVPIFLSAIAYNKVFERIEDQVLEGLEQQRETVIIEE